MPPAARRAEWRRFAEELGAAERAGRVAEGGFAFAFREGALVGALRAGDWVLLDEINLAPSEVLPELALIAPSPLRARVQHSKVSGVSVDSQPFADGGWYRLGCLSR